MDAFCKVMNVRQKIAMGGCSSTVMDESLPGLGVDLGQDSYLL